MILTSLPLMSVAASDLPSFSAEVTFHVPSNFESSFSSVVSTAQAAAGTSSVTASNILTMFDLQNKRGYEARRNQRRRLSFLSDFPGHAQPTDSGPAS